MKQGTDKCWPDSLLEMLATQSAQSCAQIAELYEGIRFRVTM